MMNHDDNDNHHHQRKTRWDVGFVWNPLKLYILQWWQSWWIIIISTISNNPITAYAILFFTIARVSDSLVGLKCEIHWQLVTYLQVSFSVALDKNWTKLTNIYISRAFDANASSSGDIQTLTIRNNHADDLLILRNIICQRTHFHHHLLWWRCPRLAW